MANVLALAGLSIASAKSYEIMLNDAVKVGNVQLAPGDYKVKVEGSNAVFTDVNNGKKTTAPVKIENTGKKHELTAVQTTKTNDGEKLQSIELGGSDQTLEFGE